MHRKSLLPRTIPVVCCTLVLAMPLSGRGKRIWVLRAPGEMVEYDPATFAAKQTVKVPAEALASPQSLSVNHFGQILFASAVSLPLAEDEVSPNKRVWFWNGRSAGTLTRDVARATSTTGSNLAITESAASPRLSEDGTHLFWFSNQARRLQRDSVDLSTTNTWQAWQTDLSGAQRQDIASVALPDCACPTGGCEESCPYAEVWTPPGGVGKFFLLTQFVSGKTQPVYQSTETYEVSDGKWQPKPVVPPLRRVLDAADPAAILEAVPDTGCCGWENQSNDQALVRLHGKTLPVFDELLTYKNPDYDASFYTQNGELSPDLGAVAMTLVSTAQANKPIQLSEQGQANPQESQRIRKALLELPAVEVKSIEGALRRIAFVPHATLVGWLSEKEILIVEEHLLVAYNVKSGTRRKSGLRVEDAAHVFLR